MNKLTSEAFDESNNEHPLTPAHEPPHNTNEGSEFLDDAIRMADQPLTKNAVKPSAADKEKESD